MFIPTAPSQKKPGKLVLTDALRVSEQPLREDKLSPLKLSAADDVETDAEQGIANASEKPMRLEAERAVGPELAEVSASEAPTSPDADETEPEAAKRDLTGSLSAKIAALEAAIARTEDQWEPDGESNDAYSGTRTRSVNWSVRDGFDEEETEEATGPVTFIRHPAKSDSRPAEVTDAQLSAEFPDEEALRAFVAQVVREELQGALGERITRNLRKMVRREIYRALVTQKLE